jgi:hypothetical protein
MSEVERSQLIDVLEQATAKLLAGEAPLTPDAEWTALLTGVLGLPITYFRALQVVLAQGRWRTAKTPKAYLRKAVKCEASKMSSDFDPKSTLQIPRKLDPDDGEEASLEEYIDFLGADTGPVKRNAVWKARNPMEEAIWVDEEGRGIPVVNGRPVPEDLLMPEDNEPDARLVINWTKVAERAGLDAEETHILKQRVAGVTREAILNFLAKNEEERRVWQAAWRRLDRHMDRVRAVFGGPCSNNCTATVWRRFATQSCVIFCVSQSACSTERLLRPRT